MGMREIFKRSVQVGVPGQGSGTWIALSSEPSGWLLFSVALDRLRASGPLSLQDHSGFPHTAKALTLDTVWTVHEALSLLEGEHEDAFCGWLAERERRGEQPLFCDPHGSEPADAAELVEAFREALIGVYASPGTHAREAYLKSAEDEGLDTTALLTVASCVNWDAVARLDRIAQHHICVPGDGGVTVLRCS